MKDTRGKSIIAVDSNQSKYIVLNRRTNTIKVYDINKYSQVIAEKTPSDPVLFGSFEKNGNIILCSTKEILLFHHGMGELKKRTFEPISKVTRINVSGESRVTIESPEGNRPIFW